MVQARKLENNRLLHRRRIGNNIELYAVTFPKVEDGHERHGGRGHDEESGRYFVAGTLHQPRRHQRRQPAEQAEAEIVAQCYRRAAHAGRGSLDQNSRQCVDSKDFVIPGRREAANPESITTGRGYGFRVLGPSGLAPE